MLAALVLLPAGAGLLAFFLRWKAPLHHLLVLTAVTHFGLTVQAWLQPPAPTFQGWMALDPLGRLFLSITSLLFLAAAVFGTAVLRHGDRHYPPGHQALFVGCLLLFLSTMTLVTVSQHFGLLWVAVEATTLASAPLIYFHRNSRSLEATWKYLVICSVGIALALLGNFFLAMAMTPVGSTGSLVLSNLLPLGPHLLVPWVKVAFLFFLVGFGTKMGLAPMHTWLPDAHSEAPSTVSALLSGALLNCAFLGVLRARQVCVAAGLAEFGQGALLTLGFLSMAFAAVFLIGQADYKRMLAYSSVEHMGILAIGIGLGGNGIFAALLHAVNHSLTKGCLFFTAGGILEASRTKAVAEITGLRRAMPWTGFLWLAGFLSITGSPPFGTFVSEILVAKAALAAGKPFVAAAFLGLLFLVFAGMARPVLDMTQGEPSPALTPKGSEAVGETLLTVLPPLVLLGAVLLLGIWMPPFLALGLAEAAALLGG